MMNKKFFLILTITTLLFSTLYAHGKKDIDKRDVEKMESWQESFDLSKKKAGKYNIMVTATDLGGNEYVEGPYNIYVDPKSDLPVCGITNPHPDMRIVGNLNIVGTCVDDDGVDYVELILDGDEQNPVRAKGKEFWSYYLDTRDLEEGLHSIKVTGCDINGLRGNSVSLTWNLDRRQPITDVTNYTMGNLVSGNVKFKGTISDGNGIKSLEYSIDGGKYFNLVKISENKKEKLWSFDIPVDTKKFPDGPAVIWFKATDNSGSVGIYSFLYFIDNTNPDVKIVYPEEKAEQNGKFCVAGYAKDIMGITKLSWMFGKDKGDLDLVPGNPYWSVLLDTTGQQGTSQKFSISATDVAGNVITVNRTILLNQELDLPVAVINYPSANAVVDADDTLFVRGIVSDDDGVQSVKFALDGKDAGSQDTKGVFCMDLAKGTDLSAGQHTVSVTPVDINGVSGHTVSATVKTKGAAPSFTQPRISAAKNSRDAVNGVMVHPEEGASLQLSVNSTAGIAHLNWKMTWGKDSVDEHDSDTGSATTVPVTVPITADSPKGAVKVTVTATDIYGRISSLSVLMNIVNTTVVSSLTPQVVMNDSGVNADGSIQLNKEFPVSGYFIGGTAAKAELTPKTPFAHLERNGNSFQLVADGGTGASGTEKVVVTTDQGLTFSSADFVLNAVPEEADPTQLVAGIATINDQPYISGMPVTIDKGASAKMVVFVDSSNSVSVAYTITGDDVPGGDVKQVGSAKMIKPADGTRWEADITLANLPVRMNRVSMTIKAGSRTTTLNGTVAVVRSGDPAKIDDKRAVYVVENQARFDSATASYIMGVNTPFAFFANVPGPVSAELVTPINGITVAVEDRQVIVTPTAEGLYKGVAVRVTDANGIRYRSSEVNLFVDTTAPEVKIVTPELFKWIRRTCTLTGTAADASGVKSIEYSVDNGATWNPCDKKGSVGATYSADISLKGIEEGIVSIDVRATDYTGRIGYAHTVVQRDMIAPDVQVILPVEDDIVNGNNLIAFKVKDLGSIDKIQYIAPGKKGADRRDIDNGPLVTTHVGTPEQPINDAMSFDFTDAAGNTTTIQSWKFNIDNKSDLPVAEIHLPSDNEVITRDFTISGVVYDDDGPCTIYYRIDNSAYQQLPETGTSFSIDVPLSAMTDNEHTATVYAVDINGVKGPEAVRKFRISLEEPKGAVTEPLGEAYVRGVITIKGVASDKNGIDNVKVSLDNGNSYNNAVGAENWSYTVDTRAIPGGTQVVFIKITDKYGIEGLYSSLLNIDNQSPEVSLELPLDDSTTTGPLFFSGNTFDNVEITELYVTIRSLEGRTVSKKLSRTDLTADRIITQVIDISSLDNGFYNVELTADDKAGNITRVSRNIQLDKSKPLATVDILYPLNGEHKQGVFNIYGQAAAEKKIIGLELSIDNKKVADADLSSTGYYKFKITPDMMVAGVHTYRVDSVIEDGTTIRSREQSIDYSPSGAWVTIDNFTYGDFAIERPYIRGNAGYAIDQDELLLSKTKEATPELRREVSLKKVAKVELSLDNGKTFIPLSEKEKWRYRIENQDIAEGYHFLLVRATMMNGETAITRTIVQIDNTKPKIRLIAPSSGGRYNQALEFSGLSSDDVGLKKVTLILRKGDKASYEVPSFIQGLYLDWHFWGATLFDIGAGLTFFDDNVKLQVQWGQFTQEQRNVFSRTDMRYGGDSVLGFKILANIAHIPFSFFWGRDFDWLSASLAIGANFSRFNETASGKPQVLSAVLGQIEFPRVHLPNVKMFSTFSLYTEGSIWFIPTDVSGTVDIKNMVPQVSEGIRLNVF